MATAKFLLGIFCLAFTFSIGLPKRNMLNRMRQNKKRENLLVTAGKEIGVRERTGNNDGERVSAYLATVGLKRPEPWCAAFICWVYARNGYLKPKSGWSPDLFPASRLTRAALPGNILGIYFPNLKRIAHVGLIVSQKDELVTSIEGNTNVAGSREGDGVYKKIRHIKTIYRIADWVTEKGGK